MVRRARRLRGAEMDRPQTFYQNLLGDSLAVRCAPMKAIENVRTRQSSNGT